MKPLRLQATNYRSFGSLDVALADGCSAVVGANGAGKSSLINLIDLALFGPESRTLADYLTLDSDGDLELTLTFEHAGDVYRVRRSFSARGRGRSTLDFERYPTLAVDDGFEGGGWEPLTQGSAKDTQALIEQALGLSRKTWRASAFLAQGDGGAFTEADPRDRKAVLAEVLALDVWEALLDHARSDRDEAKRKLTELDGAAALLQEEASKLEDATVAAATAAETVRLAGEALVAAETETDGLAQSIRSQEQAAERREAARARLAAARATYDALVAINDAAEAALDEKTRALDEIATLATVDDLARLEAEAQRLRDRQAAEALAIQDYQARRRERDLLAAQRDAADAQTIDLIRQSNAAAKRADELEAAGPGTEACDHCGQTLGEEALRSTVLRLRNEALELSAAGAEQARLARAIDVFELEAKPTLDAELVGAVEAAREALAEAQREQEQRARLQERVRALDEKIVAAEADGFLDRLAAAADAVANASQAFAALPAEADDPGVLRAGLLAAQGRVTVARERLDEATSAKVLADAALQRAKDAGVRLVATAEQRELLQQELDLVCDLEKAYGRDGVPALIVESQAIPQIEADANRILADLGTAYRVELRTQRELKSGDGLRDTLDVVVVTPEGARPYETFSGGERTRLNLALRIALARLLAHRRGADSRLLAIDEPDGLDADGFARLAEVLRAESATFDRILVISHHPDLAGAFDSTLEVVKVDGRSKVLA